MSVSHQDLANAIRALAMDAVEAANSGHPGMPMGMADAATVLFSKFLKFDPKAPDWPDRDRFVLSAGHGSMLLYALLHLTGYKRPTMKDIRNFRQLHSPCAGHPEFGELPGVETTTGPLGQGLAMAVGMAIAEQLQAVRLGKRLCDHYTYVIAGDGCLMEGVSHEAIGLAGHLGLSKLLVLWDDNHISIDGDTGLATSENIERRFKAAGWHVVSVDGHDPKAVEAALADARAQNKPSLIGCRTVIGFGAPNKQGTAGVHGAPLGADEIAAARESLGWRHAPFRIPAPILQAWRKIGQRGERSRKAWDKRFKALAPARRREIQRVLDQKLPKALDEAMAAYKAELIAKPQKVATRKASQMALEVINAALPETVGGSADLTGSNNTQTKGLQPITANDFKGRYIHYGVREFGMAAAMNGMALHGGVLPYGGTFLVFADYARPAMRLSALMRQRVIYVMTHDSIGLGEDGPTHQPIEHLMSLRAMPNMLVLRPADVVETAECWQLALARTAGPSVLALTRQGLPQLRLKDSAENACAKGGYVLKHVRGKADVTLLATGSEVAIAVDAADALAKDGVKAQVVSMPCWELFDAQPDAYRRRVLGDGLKVSIEAGVTLGWQKYVGADGLTLGIDSYGASAPAKDLFAHFGLTPERVVAEVRKRL